MHKIKELREAKGLTQKELGERIGVAQSAVAQWELGTKVPSLPNFVRISDALDATLDQVMGRTPV